MDLQNLFTTVINMTVTASIVILCVLAADSGTSSASASISPSGARATKAGGPNTATSPWRSWIRHSSEINRKGVLQNAVFAAHPKPVILSERSESKDLRTDGTFAVRFVRRSFDSFRKSAIFFSRSG